MGFVPAKADSVVVLLCRVCVEGAPGLKVSPWDGGAEEGTAEPFIDSLLVTHPREDVVKYFVLPMSRKLVQHVV